MAEDTRIVVGVSGSTGNLAALHRAVQETRLRNAVLVPVIAWTPVGGEAAYRAAPCPELARIWVQDARDRLDAAVARAFGGHPADIRIEPVVMRGETGPVLTRVADRPGDLLVVGTGRRSPLRTLLQRGSVSRYCLAHAACTVVAVPPTASVDTGAAGSDRRPALAAA
ncbi:universal stress protein [Kitasatospora sp. NBC_01560]|uniref:universal stress protein n=1 Tax=Kitasatospora sp. NBC_01560 TaxID=2975965 RepID=UPI0038689126